MIKKFPFQIIPQSDERIKWEQKLISEIEEKLEATTSDAQGILMTFEDKADQLYNDGIDPVSAAATLLEDTLNKMIFE
jgi:hypothetical protein